MQLTRYTDYSLRVLIYLSIQGDKISTIEEIRDYYQISKNHLMKVVHNLSIEGFIETTRGKNGGMKLAHLPHEISVGDVVRRMEPHFNIVECFSVENQYCRVQPICSLKTVLNQASKQFLRTLDGYSLADAVNLNANQQLVEFDLSRLPDKPA